nr:L,D-transpeptidase [Nocardioides sp. MAH-18]
MGAFPSGGDPAPAAADIGTVVESTTPSATPTPSPTPVETPSEAADPTALPAGSGSGKRVVFSEGAQRVWLVDDEEEVRRTYLVSGSVLDNLQPGTYDVYSKSRWAVGIDDSGVMEYFVRFTKGPSGAAIGFHTIPTKQGVPLQSEEQLGTPQSHGCIRQDESDAIALWDFAPEGTAVVVTA